MGKTGRVEERFRSLVLTLSGDQQSRNFDLGLSITGVDNVAFSGEDELQMGADEGEAEPKRLTAKIRFTSNGGSPPDSITTSIER